MTILVEEKKNLSKSDRPITLLPITPFQLMTPPEENNGFVQVHIPSPFTSSCPLLVDDAT
jgi:hypothetical protein